MNKKSDLAIRGIVPPVATPMRANEDLDLARLRWFLDRLIENGVHGVFVLGTNSEFYALDEREKQEVIASAVACEPSRPRVRRDRGRVDTRGAAAHQDGRA
jgi:4-hydroxy-tetrahydrodipicolinate synthase